MACEPDQIARNVEDFVAEHETVLPEIEQAALRAHQEAVYALRNLGAHFLLMGDHLERGPWEDDTLLSMDRQGEDRRIAMQDALKRFAILRDCHGGTH